MSMPLNIWLIALTLAFAAPASAQDALPLAERRAVKAYQDDLFPAQLAAIHAAAGFALPVEVRWDVVARPGQAERFKQPGYFTNVYFAPLALALKGVAGDEMGKQAVKARLKQVVFTYDKASAPLANYANGLTLDNGVLTINFEPGVNEHSLNERAKAIQTLLEAKL